MSNSVFIVIFLLEAIVKIIGLGLKQYCRSHQNLFDFLLVVISSLEMAGSLISFNVTLLRVIRCQRILRVFESLHEIVEMIKNLMSNFMSFIQIIIIDLIMLFVYTLLSMTLFYDVKLRHNGGIDENANFSNFYLSFMTL